MLAQRLRKYKERLFERIYFINIIISACFRCYRRSDVYVVSSDSDRCVSYVLAGSDTKYDVFGSSPSE